MATMYARKWDQVEYDFAKVAVRLARKVRAGGDDRHGSRYQLRLALSPRHVAVALFAEIAVVQACPPCGAGRIMYRLRAVNVVFGKSVGVPDTAGFLGWDMRPDFETLPHQGGLDDRPDTAGHRLKRMLQCWYRS